MLPTQQHTPPTAATKATPVLTNVLRYLMPVHVPVYLFIYFFAKGLTLYAFVVCFGRLPQGAQQCFEKSLGEWALLTRYDQCAGILGKDALAALSLMPKWPKLTKPIVRSQPVPTSTELSPLVRGSDGGGINGDTVTQGDVQNALAQVPPSVRKVLPEGSASIYAFIVCYGRLPVKGDTLTVGSTQHEVYKWAQVLLKSQATEDKPLSAELRGAFEAIPMWPVFSSTGIVL